MSIFSPSQYICFKLSRAMRKVQRYYEVNLAPLEITTVQFYVLSSLWETDGIKFKELAQKLSMDGATLTGILDRLERQEFVLRADDPEDRRSVLVFLAEKAKMYRDEFQCLAETLDNEIKHQFSSEDFAIFSRMLNQIGES
ncbi:MarR family winged helix-turn-helix transcriptional regulator [Desulfosporosinus shakirovi]|uniref:MarR family winged helix-turn-helix transcriptional regulator n=1 Tax=Desulfosporosinus shakirovi TaxID=2885154 RepID=UPI001E465B69|nr:MarR family transcriptional regulator [Desulfosporosinus sp. SRJS8]MCB8818339.1 MarR family transcriptional regulator [Desulfosporosinus sp. SRJS8]